MYSIKKLKPTGISIKECISYTKFLPNPRSPKRAFASNIFHLQATYDVIEMEFDFKPTYNDPVFKYYYYCLMIQGGSNSLILKFNDNELQIIRKYVVPIVADRTIITKRNSAYKGDYSQDKLYHFYIKESKNNCKLIINEKIFEFKCGNPAPIWKGWYSVKTLGPLYNHGASFSDIRIKSSLSVTTPKKFQTSKMRLSLI